MVEIFNVIPQILHGVGQTFLELSPSPTSPIIHLMITAEMSNEKAKKKKKKKGRHLLQTQSKGMQAASWSTFLVASDNKKTETRVRLWNTIYRRKARPSEICRQRFLHGSGTEDRQEQTLAENALW